MGDIIGESVKHSMHCVSVKHSMHCVSLHYHNVAKEVKFNWPIHFIFLVIFVLC
jgi:hypothetical protein